MLAAAEKGGGPMSDTYDSPWKELIEAYFPQFMAFFFPQAHADIDWSRGWESLDQELQQVVRDAEMGRRLADKLFKVWRRNGEEQIVLVHIEVQGEPEEDFPLRMFLYNYRIFDRHGKPVVSLAVLGDDRPDWRPESYGWELWGCRMGIRFPVVKLRDYDERWEELEASSNPFAPAVMAHLATRRTRRDPQDRLQWKTRLVRRLYERGHERQEILDLFRFLDWLLALPPELEERFQDDLKQFEAELNMPYVTNIERRGIEQGIQQGLLQGEASVLRRQLARRFASLPAWVDERLEHAKQKELERWADRILDARRLEDVFGSAEPPSA
jgi:hypothetical protein